MSSGLEVVGQGQVLAPSGEKDSSPEPGKQDSGITLSHSTSNADDQPALHDKVTNKAQRGRAMAVLAKVVGQVNGEFFST